MLAALSLWLAVGVGFEIIDRFLRDLNYFDRFPQYLAFAAIVLWLGLEGWRHASHRFPLLTDRVSPPVDAVDAPPPDTVAVATSVTAAQWLAQVEAAGWWREPGLTLEQVARRLGTNESYVSRAFNAGAGRNFNFAINALRVRAVQQAPMAGDARGGAGDRAGVGFFLQGKLQPHIPGPCRRQPDRVEGGSDPVNPVTARDLRRRRAEAQAQ